MNQQQQQNQNKINNFVINNPISQHHAEYLNKKVLRNICKFFYPFKQYYTKYSVQYIVEPSPTYIQKQQLQQKTYLTIAKQMQYFRGTSDHHLQQQYLSQLLNEDIKDRGLMENHQNKSLFCKGLFIYADDCKLTSIRMSIGDKNQNKNLGVWKVYHQFAQPIMQITNLRQFQIIVRCRYWITLFDIFKNSIIAQIRLKQQITSYKIFQNNQQVLISTYDQNNYRLYQWKLTKNQITLIKQCSSLWGINSMINLNIRQFIICLANKIQIQDLRCNSRQTLRRVTQIGNDRFCSIVQVASKPNYIGLSKSQYIDVFDLRKPQVSFYTSRHFCQEAPPTCLLSQVWIQPIIIAYSPSKVGSSILVNLFQQKQSQISKIYQKNSAFPMLLYDSGKYYNGLHPKSITPIIQDNILRLIHIDSSNGISLQILQKQDKTFNITHLKSSAWACYPQDPNKKWIQQKLLQPYIIKKTKKNNSQQSQENFQQQQIFKQNKIFKKNINFCSLDKFRQKIHKLSQMPEMSQNRKSNQEIDTYASSFQQTQPQHSWAQILKHIDNSNNSLYKINEQLIEYMDKDWKL